MMYFYISPASEDLQHHGIKNMKWGFRRFQNPDGTLTELGKKRYRMAGKLSSSHSNITKAAQSAKKLKSDIERPTQKPPKDLSQMSDQELRDRVNRLQLEEQYNRLTSNSRQVSKGSQFVDRALDIIGDTAMLAGSIASIVVLFGKKS